VPPRLDLDSLRADFAGRGFVGPLPLLARAECAPLLARLRRRPERPPVDWHKGWAASSPAYCAIATDERVLALVTPLLGRDVLLWGASLIVRKPGGAHPWHTDIESAAPDAETVSVWIGLDGTGRETALALVARSHRFGVPLQQVAHENGATRDARDDAAVARWARVRDPEATIETPACGDGDAIVFDGRLWHASHNRSGSRTRQALLLQYATPRTPIRIPNPSRLEWPFESYDVPRPPCVVVRGGAETEPNRIVPAPVAAQGDLAVLSANVQRLALPLERDRERGWKPHPLLRGATPNLPRLAVHVSVLEPGCEPHDPHVHDDEDELLILLDGAATLRRADSIGSVRLVEHAADPGSFAFYPAGLAHTLRASADAPATYVMFKWRGAAEGRASLGGVFVTAAGGEAPRRHGDGFETQRCLEGSTRALRRLHVHRSTFAPGAGYAPHADAHDVAMIVLDGAIETLGARVEKHGVAFCSGGHPHGVRNPGATPARYLVLEFHGRPALDLAAAEPAFRARANPSRARRLLRSIWRRPHAAP
jgi:uncharacterized cupin superfamily protein